MSGIDGAAADHRGERASQATLSEQDALARDLIGRGTFMGRYQIVEQLASGGMGVVFRAYDPELSRPVALKLVQQRAIDIEHLANVDEYERRLLREAQALARLSHPNVVAAFDIGKYEGNLFIAMELIDGVSLSEWLRQKPRSRAEILRLMIDAGRGLSEKLNQIDTLMDLFERADITLVDRSRAAVRDLATLADCADTAALLTESEELPDDPERRRQIGVLTAELAAIDALRTAGNWQDGLTRAQAVITQAERLNHKPTQARAMKEALFAMQRLGRPEEANVLLHQALTLAADARVTDVVSWLGARLLLAAVDAGQNVQARAMLPFVDALVRMEGRPMQRSIRLLAFEADILASERQFDRAAEKLNTALADCRTLGSDGLTTCLTPQRALGLLHAVRKNYPAAQRELEAAVELALQYFGPGHPQVVNEYNNLASIMVDGGELEVAARALARSKELAATLPPNRQTANIPAIDGRIWEARGDCARALPLYEEGLQRVAAAYGAESGQTTNGHFHLGSCLTKLGRRSEALPHLERAVTKRRAAQEAAPSIAEALFGLAQALGPGLPDRRRARALAEEALTLFRSDGADSAEQAQAVERWLALQD